MHQNFYKLLLYFASQSELDAKKNELAAQRIALEEERLLRQDESERIHESEADAIRGKLKEQVKLTPVFSFRSFNLNLS